MPSNPSSLAPSFELALWQFAPVLRDLAGNAARIGERADAAAADLFVTPELSLTGYDVRDDVHDLARSCVQGDELAGLNGSSSSKAILAGLIERGDDLVPYNAAVLLEQGRMAFRHRKIYLPTYGMFDEARYFGAGSRVDCFELNGWRIGVLVCEDFWHPMLSYLLAMQGVQLLVVMAAAPGRGAWQGGEEGHFFASTDAWLRIARAYAQLYGVYVAVCNRTGVEGAVTFAGESFVIAPDAGIVAQAGTGEELLSVSLHAAAVRGARTPYAHVRDEDASLAVREIERLLAR